MELEDPFVFSKSDIYKYLDIFEDMKLKGQFCDVTIRVLNRSFSAHRIILAAGIPYFREVFTTDKEIELTEICPDALESLIEFAYSGKIKITFENVRPVLSASVFLQLGEVEEACFNFLSLKLCPINAPKIRALIEGFQCLDLIESSDTFIQENFGELSETEEFLSLPFSSLKEVVSKDYLNVESEEIIFETIVKWVKVSTERRVMLPELLSLVRLAHINPRYLVEEVAREELVRASIPCRDLIDEAKNYHLLPHQITPCIIKTQARHLKNENHMYVVSDSKNFGISIKYYNTSSEEWSTSVACKESKNVKHVVSVCDQIYVFGDKLEAFSLKTEEWTSVSSDTPALMGASVVSHQGKIYMIDGVFGGPTSCVLRCFDPILQKWSSVSVITPPRIFAGMVSSGDYIYILGGQCSGYLLDSVEKYNTRTKVWEKVSPMLTKRGRHSCAAQGGRIYVCGGYCDFFSSSVSAEVYDPKSDEWSSIAPIRSVRHVHSLVSCNQKLYAVGDCISSNPFKCTYSFDVHDSELNEWKPGGIIPVDESMLCTFTGAVIVSGSLDQKMKG